MSLDVRRAEERARREPCSACILTIDEDGRVHHDPGCSNGDFLALAALARRLAQWTTMAHNGHPKPESCYGCKLAEEAKAAGLLED